MKRYNRYIITIYNQFIRFTKIKAFTGILLITTTIVALYLANSQYAEAYHSFWEKEFMVGFLHLNISHPLHVWINDGLMAMFFFVVGLEIKREIYAGQLSSFKKAALPICAALGGMIIPGLIFLFINWNLDTADGWGIPMATDIAFSLGILALLGNRVPIGAKIFLTTFAIVDDLGAVLIIALFYSSDISVISLVVGGIFLTIMFGANVLGVKKGWFYAILGIGGLWVSFLLSGIHPTISGVLAAFAIPAKSNISLSKLSLKLKYLVSIKFMDPEFRENKFTIVSSKNVELITTIKKTSHDAIPPLQWLEKQLTPWAYYVIMPIFVLANAGVTIKGVENELLSSPVSLGIICGLIFGKVIGINLFCWLAVKCKIASLPLKTNWKNLIGIGFLGGMGFTMSLFITGLAFSSSEIISQATLGIFVASIVSGVLGFFILKFTLGKKVRRGPPT